MTDKARQSLGEHVREAREAAGLSIRELARLAGIDFAYLSRLEKDERGASADVLQRLADVLTIDAGELLAYIGVKPNLPEPRIYFRRKLGVDAEEAEVLARLVEDYQERKKKGGIYEDTN